MTIGAIIPVKNEKGNIVDMVNSAIDIEPLSQIIFVDGNSNDGTQEMLTTQISRVARSHVSWIKQESPFGKFQAIVQALPFLKTDHVLIWDGDNTIAPENVSEIILLYMEEKQKRNCIIIANRLTRIKLDNSFKPLNLLGNHLFSFLAWPMFGEKIPDVLSGVKIFPKILLTNPNNCTKLLDLDKYGDIAILAMAKKNSLKFLSVPCVYRPRTYGKTSLRKCRDGSNILFALIHSFTHKCFKP